MSLINISSFDNKLSPGSETTIDFIVDNIDKNKLPEFIIPKSGYPMMYLAKDIDGDGDIDFYNANSNYKVLFINDGKGNLKNGL